MADVTVSVIQSAPVHPPGHGAQFADQRRLDGKCRRVFLPVQAEILKADDAGQFPRDQKGLQMSRIRAPHTVCAWRHGIDILFFQVQQCAIFIIRPENGAFELEQVLENFMPSASVVEFGEIPLSAGFKTEGVAALDLPEAFTVQPERLGERVFVRSEFFERGCKRYFLH